MARTIICVLCGDVAEVHKNAGNAKYCVPCRKIVNKKRNLITARKKHAADRAARKIATEFCTCGCGRPRTVGFTFLNKVCWEDKHNDLDNELEVHMENANAFLWSRGVC